MVEIQDIRVELVEYQEAHIPIYYGGDWHMTATWPEAHQDYLRLRSETDVLRDARKDDCQHLAIVQECPNKEKEVGAFGSCDLCVKGKITTLIPSLEDCEKLWKIEQMEQPIIWGGFWESNEAFQLRCVPYEKAQQEKQQIIKRILK